MRCRASTRALAALAATATFAFAAGPALLAPFSEATPGGALPAGWTPLTFPNIARHTQYTLVRDEAGTVVVQAYAQDSASGLVHKLDVPAADRPRLAWRWKAAQVVADGDVTRRDGDDYPTRVYVTFRYTPERLSGWQRLRYAALRALYGEYPPHAGLTYVWDARAPRGTVVPSAYTDRVRMIVVESGTANLGRWLAYERDVVADYRAAFGEDPPPISGVAIMTDTDNTGATVTAWYGDVALLPP
ncbi:MAG: DUF3047 domain-containing protein [Burkholderiales bacterium]